MPVTNVQGATTITLLSNPMNIVRSTHRNHAPAGLDQELLQLTLHYMLLANFLLLRDLQYDNDNLALSAAIRTINTLPPMQKPDTNRQR